jgi:hypothetical protein
MFTLEFFHVHPFTHLANLTHVNARAKVVMILPVAILTASHLDIISIMGDEGCNWYVP